MKVSCVFVVCLFKTFDIHFLIALTLSSLASTFVVCLYFESGLDPFQDQRSVYPDLDPNHFTVILLKEFLKS